MESVNYAQLGLKSGVEIHQQILTDHKMFCRCPAGQYSDTYDAEVLRHMRPTLSEMGTYDGTALMEFKTKKEVVYQINKKSVCTYELDDTPPFLVNAQGLDIAIEIALLLNCKLVDELFITRKQYLDGSIPAGFQRTAIVGVDGWIPYKDRKIKIVQLGYEEDACREVSDVGHRIVFRTDRLSMPLIEVVTAPDMHTPEEFAEVVTRLGRLLRATGKVRRGIGSVRQDVNVSIAGSTRVEIKGVPRIGYLPALVHTEAMRQKALLEIRDELSRRKITEETLQAPTASVTDLFSDTACEPVRAAVAAGESVRAIKLSGFADVLNHPVQPGRTFATEFAGRVRVVACIDAEPNLIHTDALPEEITAEEHERLRQELDATEQDVIVVTFGADADTQTAVEEIRLRAIEAIHGVPNETRQRLDGGLSDFERILPGPDRMYPDTDSPPTKITAERVARIRAQLPERPWEREERYATLGIPQGVGYALAISPYAKLFDRLAERHPKFATRVAVTLTQTTKALRRAGIPVENLTDAHFEALFDAHAQGTLEREAIPDTLRELAAHPDKSVESLGLARPDPSRIGEAIDQVLSEDSYTGRSVDGKVDYYVGKVLHRLKTSIGGRQIAERVRKKLQA